MALQDFMAEASPSLGGRYTREVFTGLIPQSHLLIAIDGEHGIN